MLNLLSLIAGPLDKDACIYFYITTNFFFILFLLAFLSNIFVFIKNRQKLTFWNIIGGLYMIVILFITYFVNRLFYTICNKSLEKID